MKRSLQYLLGLLIALIVLVLAIGLLNQRATSPQSRTLIAAPSATVVPTPGRNKPAPLATLAAKPPPATATVVTGTDITNTALETAAQATTPAAVMSQSVVTTTASPSSTVHISKLVAPRLYTYKVVNILPHDPAAFTEGLDYEDGKFYEGTGMRGASNLRRVDPESGTIEQIHDLDAQYFGEGVTVLGEKIYQLTWQEQTGFIYDKSTFAELGRFNYSTEGWGMTHDGNRLIVSDGTSVIYFWDPETLQTTGGIYISLLGLPVDNINELEVVDGEIFANVWKTDLVLRIDPASGQVNGVVDLSGLLAYGPPPTGPVDVLNGIAYDSETGRLWVTGKYWPAIFEIELVEVNQ